MLCINESSVVAVINPDQLSKLSRTFYRLQETLTRFLIRNTSECASRLSIFSLNQKIESDVVLCCFNEVEPKHKQLFSDGLSLCILSEL